MAESAYRTMPPKERLEGSLSAGSHGYSLAPIVADAGRQSGIA
jgi:hypothetical protein